MENDCSDEKENSILVLQSCWEAPCISQFLILFGHYFDLPAVDVEDLEKMLMEGQDVWGRSIDDLIADLLRRIYVTKKSCLKGNDYSSFLRRFLRRMCFPQKFDFGDDFDVQIPFRKQPLQTQLKILHSLCYFLFHPDTGPIDLWEETSTKLLRTEPIGVDSQEFTYWYLSGRRLYKSKDDLWVIVCFDIKDWTSLISDLLLSESRDDVVLGRAIKQIRNKEVRPSQYFYQKRALKISAKN